MEISETKLKSIEAEDFVNAKKLTHISFSKNSINILKAHIFKHAKLLTFIRFENNKLEFINKYTFEGLHKLGKIHLLESNLKMLHCQTFVNLKKSVVVDISQTICSDSKNAGNPVNSLIYLSKCHSYYVEAEEQYLEAQYNKAFNWAVVCSIINLVFLVLGLGCICWFVLNFVQFSSNRK